MVNPLAPVYEWWLEFYLLIPAGMREFINLKWILLFGFSVVGILWRAKH